jgi:hypothetical protein
MAACPPSAARTPPVVSVFLNDILLGAKQLDAKGKLERITAPIPRYALSARNTLRLSFVRQMASDRCRETPEAYPVSILPSSHMTLEKSSPTDDFTGMVARYAGGANVMVPAAYLADATRTLPRVIRMAASTGVSPQNARFTAVNSGAPPAPGGAFLALDLPFKDSKSRVTADAGHVVLTSASGDALFDANGLNNIGVVEVTKVDGDTGVIYRTIGATAPAMDKPIRLADGDVALIGASGLLREVNSADPAGRNPQAGPAGSWLLGRGYWWMLPVVLVAFMIGLLVFASRARRRRAAAAKQ